ncbi:MAG: hypothetical protein FWC50_07110 [Planctomycetaceae bacterium]|nr:hypothetical protein [Planctomycetaceae bacterium]
MTRYLAVDWDGTEIRAVLAVLQRGSIKVLKAESSPLEVDDTTSESPKVDYGLSLKNLLKRHDISKANLLLGLNRSAVEMMAFTLPKAKEEELPDLVKNQVMRDSTSYSETSAVDFVTSPSFDRGTLRTLAATITRNQLKQYRNVGQTAGIRIKRIEFCPLAFAELYRRSNLVSDEPVLLVRCTTDEADMLVIAENHLVFLRSIKFPATLPHDEKNARLYAEISRTVAVSRQELEGSPLEKIIIFGDTVEFQSLQERLTDSELQTIIVNPTTLPCIQWSVWPSSQLSPSQLSPPPQTIDVREKTDSQDDAPHPDKEMLIKIPENPGNLPGRYAALLGMILGEQSKSSARIDFLHPREKPQQLNIARFAVLFLVLIGILGYGAYAWNQGKLRQLQEELARLTEENKALTDEYQKALPQFRQLWSAHQWDSQQMIWLDELRDISVRLPSEQELVITGMQYSFGFNNQPYGVIDLTGRVSNLQVLLQIYQRFNGGSHRAFIMNQQQSQRGGGYPWLFSIRIVTARRTAPYYLQYLSPELRKLSSTSPFPQPVPHPTPTQPATTQPTPTQPTTAQPTTTQPTATQQPEVKP